MASNLHHFKDSLRFGVNAVLLSLINNVDRMNRPYLVCSRDPFFIANYFYGIVSAHRNIDAHH